MFRIKTTCKNKAVFLSPFVFTEDQAEKKIKSIQRWHYWRDWPKFEIVSVKKYPEHTAWKKTHPIFDPMVNESLRMLNQLEEMWVKLFNREYAKVQKVKDT